jgi:DtxR family Mn-dependent transcriptional regulator
VVREGEVISQAIQDYLKMIYHLQEADKKVTITAISEEMGVSAASVTNMVKKLAEMGLLHHTPYQEVTLTSPGEKIALEVIRHHRLLEMYLKETLGYSWDQVHEEAETLEHVISEEFEERIDKALGRPKTDPHGSPIPGRDGKIVKRKLLPLTDAGVGEFVTVQWVKVQDPERLRYLESLGLLPGVEVKILEKKPFEGPIVILVGTKKPGMDKKETIGHELARHIWVGYKED